MKKVFGVSTFILFMTTLVSAQTSLAGGLSKGMNQLLGAIEGMLGPFFSAILGGGKGMLFEKILFLVIIFAIVYVIVKKMPVFKGNDAIIWIVSISISLLSTRFMSGDLLQTMLLPYSTLGVTLTAALPLLIFFAFVQSNDNKVVRKTLWIFYIVVFTTIWGSRYESVGNISWIYMGSAAVALLFFLMDGTIRRARLKQKMSELDHEKRMVMISDIKDKLGELEEKRTKGNIDETTYTKVKKRLEKQIKGLSKNTN